MKFTRNSINKNQSLLSYLLNNVAPIAHRQENGTLVNVYDTKIAIKSLQAKIKRHRLDARYNKFSRLWESHIKVLKELK